MSLHNWPQFVVLGWMALGFALACDFAGEPQGRYSPVSVLIRCCIWLFLLFEGGFFASLGWVQ